MDTEFKIRSPQQRLRDPPPQEQGTTLQLPAERIVLLQLSQTICISGRKSGGWGCSPPPCFHYSLLNSPVPLCFLRRGLLLPPAPPSSPRHEASEILQI